MSRQQHLRFDAKQSRRKFEIFRGVVQLQHTNAQQKLLRDVRDRDVVDVDLFIADQREQQVERPREGRQVDEKTGRCLSRITGRRDSG